jgi:hypothetical protein
LRRSDEFVATAVAKKVSALETARFFEERGARADFRAFDKIMRRRHDEPPLEGDEMPKYEMAIEAPTFTIVRAVIFLGSSVACIDDFGARRFT